MKEGNNITYPVKVLEGNIPKKFGQASLFIDHWHAHPDGAFLAGALVGHAITRASQPKTVVVQEPTYVYSAPPTYSATSAT